MLLHGAFSKGFRLEPEPTFGIWRLPGSESGNSPAKRIQNGQPDFKSGREKAPGDILLGLSSELPNY